MNIYFDTEFTGLHKDTSLISIGLVTDDNRTFYAELIDYDKKQVDEWIKNNVINHLKFNGQYKCTQTATDCELSQIKPYVRESLKKWLSQFDSVQFVSDVCHYDFVLLIDLFGTAFDLPSNVSASCHDINQDIAKYYGVSEKETFDVSREEILAGYGIHIDGDKHNALYDAKVIKAIYEVIHK